MDPANIFDLSFLMDLFRVRQQFASYSRKIIENLQFAFRLRYFPKTFFVQPPPTLASVAQTTHAYKLFPQAPIYLGGPMLVYMLIPPY